MKKAPMRLALMASIASVVTLASVQPASAIIVYDPSNYAQNVLTAARTLEQINNQIRQLQNQATSLMNEAKNLANLPLDVLQPLQDQIRQTQQLINQAQHLAYNVQDIERTFADKYKSIPMSASNQTLVANARERWETSVGAFEDALKVQAGVVGNIEGSRATMERLVTASQSATGALQAAQAGNQLLALQSQQLADLTAMLSAQARSQSLEAARQATAEADGRERFRRFIGGK